LDVITIEPRSYRSQISRKSEYVEGYRNHPQSKAAAPDGSPAGPQTRGVLGRLHLTGGKLIRVGKEVDRLAEEDGIDLLGGDPATFEGRPEDELAWAMWSWEPTPAPNTRRA
jgi:hypothetical protein